MRGLARREGAPEATLRGATRIAFERVVTLAVEENVAAVVVAGDLFDGDRDDYQTAVFLQRQLYNLRDAGVRVVLAYGNHDAASEITRRLRLPDNCRALSPTEAETVVHEDLGLALHGRSYATRAVTEDLSAGYPLPIPNLLNVGILHTSLEGRPGHDRYSPCTTEDLLRRGYGYWALGHIHKREEITREGVAVVFPGNICGRHVGETGSKGASLVEYDDDTVAAVTHRELAPVRWHTVEVNAVDAKDMAEVAEVLFPTLEALRVSSIAELHAVRLSIAASESVAAEWFRNTEQVETQLRADATGADGAIWLEQIAIRASQPPVRPPDEAMAAVTETLAELRAGDDGRAATARLLAEVRSRFGAELEEAVRLGAVGLDDASSRALLEESAALLAAELGGGR